MSDKSPPPSPEKPNQLIARRRKERGFSMREVIRRSGTSMGHGTLARMERRNDWSFVSIGSIKGVARALDLSSLELAALALGETLAEGRAEPPAPLEVQALVSLMAGDSETTRRLIREMPRSQVRDLELTAARLVSLCLERLQSD